MTGAVRRSSLQKASAHLASKADSVGNEAKVVQTSKVGRAVSMAGLSSSTVVVGIKGKSSGGGAAVVGDHGRGPASVDIAVARARVDGGLSHFLLAVAIREKFDGDICMHRGSEERDDGGGGDVEAHLGG